MPCERLVLAQGMTPRNPDRPGRRHDGSVSYERSGRPASGQIIELDVGEPVHGGSCIARTGSGLVFFVRHALPGERVRAVVTQTTARLVRADAVEILRAAPERVSPPCPYAVPGGCGGCDWQHASLAAQRAIKAQVISQQLRRIARIDRQVTVEALPGDAGGLGWRTRVRFAVRRDGQAGLRRHRSHDIVPVRDCLIAHPLVSEAGVTRQRWPAARWVEVAVAAETGQRAVLAPGAVPTAPRFLTQRAAGREWRVAAGGFWQVHPGAADVLAEAVLASLRPRPGETALDLYCGAGLFAGVLADAVGPGGMVIGVEQDAAAVRDARHNLRSAPWARILHGDAADVAGAVLAGDTAAWDAVACTELAAVGPAGQRPAGPSIAVLDPPRTGAGRGLTEALCARPGLRAVAYVSCDPATLARDIGAFAGLGWHLTGLRAFDAFPMTHHVECLAVLAPVSSGPAGAP
jgi:tRNA/tmRNA/rRNA uracil-C5-methylase (TrmA/RlmC/RlmD family)